MIKYIIAGAIIGGLIGLVVAEIATCLIDDRRLRNIERKLP